MILAAQNAKKAHLKNLRYAHNENNVSFYNMFGKQIEKCRIKKVRSPLRRNCGMYRKYKLSGRGYREWIPCSCHAHGIPFRGDSILFRLPRQPAGTFRRKANHDCSTGWPVLSLNSRKHPAKCGQAGRLYRVCIVLYAFL